MENKPDRRHPSTSNSVSTVTEIALKGAFGALPGGSLLFDLLKARREEMGDAMRKEAEKRLDAFYAAMLEANVSMDDRQARALLDDADFHALLRACIADIEAEKVEAYTALARGIANGSIEKKTRRHFILSLRDMSVDELGLLRNAFVAREQKMIPAQGSGTVAEDEFLSPGQPGSFRSIHVSNLTTRGYVHDGKLSTLGSTFTQAIWRPEKLTPGSLGYLTWSDHNVVIINNEIGNGQSDQISTKMTELLRELRCKSIIVASTRDTVPQARLFATHGLLLIGDKAKSLSNHIDALKSLLAKVPTLGVLISQNAVPPDGLKLLGIVRYDPSQGEDGLSEICRLLFKKARGRFGSQNS